MPSPPDWLPFDAFMQRALYDPLTGYYMRGAAQIGTGIANRAGDQDQHQPSDFVTAPVLSPHFGAALSVQLLELLRCTRAHDIWEFGAGTGDLALQLLRALGESDGGIDEVKAYHIVDVSGALKAQQHGLLEKNLSPRTLQKVCWHDTLPAHMSGVFMGNEVLDALPVKLLARVQGVWHERGVIPSGPASELHPGGAFIYHDVPTDLRPPVVIAGTHDYVTEIHPQAQAFMQTLSGKLLQAKQTRGEDGAILMIDYGFCENEYYLSSRMGGTLMCHRRHQADAEPLLDVGEKDITAHVNFTAVALAAQDAGLHVNGFATQGRFLLNCGLLDLLQEATPSARAQAQKLVTEHEMGELFKVLCCSTLEELEPLGFRVGERMHTL